MKTTVTPGKTVYILGAGFSAPAGGPNQASLLKKIFDLPNSSPEIRKCKRGLKKFLVNTLNVSPRMVSEIALEDIYTPIDRCIANGVAFRNTTVAQLQVIRGQLELLISLAIDYSFHGKPSASKQYVKDFAKVLVSQASHRSELAKNTDSAASAKAYDPLSIISLNWDIVLDRCLYEALCEHDGGEDGDYEPIGVVDYCCYISSLGESEKRIRSGLWALGSKGFNVKLLKIHGSMNWLQCSNCQRLFVSFNEKVSILNFFDTQMCRHCQKYDVAAKLQGSLVMPTFLKDLSNFQIKLVWQNAAVELMEAKKLVFIGYSLPYADFEFRQLLSRMIHKNAEIHVVLFKPSTPVGEKQYEEECARYSQFFSGHHVTFEPNGVKAFVDTLPKVGPNSKHP